MVALSLYRGNMHRVTPDIPRRWLTPKPQISLKNFRTLLLRRSKALSSTSTSTSTSSVFATATAFFPLPENPNSFTKLQDAPNQPPPLAQVASLIDAAAAATTTTTQAVEKEQEKEKEKEEEDEKVAEGNKKLDPVDDEKEKRKKEVEEKLHVLNEKKHNLVKALKQILNAEEELKRRSSMQAGRPPLPLQADASHDSGSMTRHATPRTGSEVNVTVDMEGVEGDDALNQNPQGRQLLRLNSTSPCAESALRRPPYFQHNAGSHPSRAGMVAAGSPSRFAPSGNPGLPSNLPTVSVTGTNYVASSPSPAASGGTSGFRDARQPSPWN